MFRLKSNTFRLVSHLRRANVVAYHRLLTSSLFTVKITLISSHASRYDFSAVGKIFVFQFIEVYIILIIIIRLISFHFNCHCYCHC